MHGVHYYEGANFNSEKLDFFIDFSYKVSTYSKSTFTGSRMDDFLAGQQRLRTTRKHWILLAKIINDYQKL